MSTPHLHPCADPGSGSGSEIGFGCEESRRRGKQQGDSCEWCSGKEEVVDQEGG